MVKTRNRVTKKPKQKNFRLTDEDFERAEEIRGDFGTTDAEIYRAGLDRFPPHEGRSRFKFAKEKRPVGFKFDRKLRNVKCENCGFTFKSSSSPGGSVCSRCSYNSSELKKEWRTITCETCGTRYQTSRTKGSSKCYVCKNINNEIEQFVWKMPKSTGPRQDISPEYAAELEEHRQAESDFNAEQMKRKTAKMAKDRKAREE